MKVRGVWQFFEAERDGNAIHLFAPAGVTPIHTFRFGRQRREDGLCLSDYILEGNPEGDAARDHLALMVVTAGAGIREKSEEWKKAGAFFKAHAIQALAIESAEATTEWLHRRIREDWGFPDAPTVTMHDRFTSKYHGKRYSFGYPACPNLDDQQGVWKLLQPDDIGRNFGLLSNRCLSKDKFPPVLDAGQRLDFGDHSPPQSMESSHNAAERECRLVWRHPVASILRRKRATLARHFAGCPRDLVRLVQRNVKVHIFSVLILLLAATPRCEAAMRCGWIARHRSVSAAASGPRRWPRLETTVRFRSLLENIRASIGTFT